MTQVVISTAQVDINIITIGSKQMTLAVFRQVQFKDLISCSCRGR